MVPGDKRAAMINSDDDQVLNVGVFFGIGTLIEKC